LGREAIPNGRGGHSRWAGRPFQMGGESIPDGLEEIPDGRGVHSRWAGSPFQMGGNPLQMVGAANDGCFVFVTQSAIHCAFVYLVVC